MLHRGAEKEPSDLEVNVRQRLPEDSWATFRDEEEAPGSVDQNLEGFASPGPEAYADDGVV